MCQAVRYVLRDLLGLRVLQLQLGATFVASGTAMHKAIALLRAARRLPGVQVHIAIDSDRCNFLEPCSIDLRVAELLVQLLQAAAPVLTALDTHLPGNIAAHVHERVRALPALAKLTVAGEALTASQRSRCDLCGALCKMTTLTYLQLSRGCAHGCAPLWRTVCGLTGLQHLQLPSSFKMAERCEVAQLQQLTYLEIHVQAHGLLPDELRTLSGLHNLRSLAIKAIKYTLPVKGLLDEFAGDQSKPKGLQHLTSLTWLCLSECYKCGFGRSRLSTQLQVTASGVAGSVAMLQGLHELHVTGPCLSSRSKVAQEIIRRCARDNATVLSRLCLCHLDFNDDEAQVIVQDVCAMTALLSLDITSVGGWGDASQALAGSLAAVRTLRRLHISQCALGDSGAKALAATLPQLTQLTHLTLSGCEISKSGASCIGKALQTLTALQQVNLCHNNYCTAGGRALVVRAAALPQLQRLSLAGSGVNYGVVLGLQRDLPSVRWLQTMTAGDLDEHALQV